MVLKRKRSEAEFSAASSILSSPSSVHRTSIDDINAAARVQTTSLVSSRTRKRHRDNRPDENTIHRHTLDLLFSAQRSQSHSKSHATRPSHPPQQAIPSLPSSASSSHQSSLHSFWALPGARQSSPASTSSSLSSHGIPDPTPHPSFQATDCEDCDARLIPRPDDAMDVDMMDVDMAMAGEGDLACSACGRMVCHSCAVSNLGADRKCLLCAGTKRGQGGPGWVPM